MKQIPNIFYCQYDYKKLYFNGNYTVSGLRSILKARDIGKSLPTGPLESTAPIANAHASVFNKNDFSQWG